MTVSWITKPKNTTQRLQHIVTISSDYWRIFLRNSSWQPSWLANSIVSRCHANSCQPHDRTVQPVQSLAATSCTCYFHTAMFRAPHHSTCLAWGIKGRMGHNTEDETIFKQMQQEKVRERNLAVVPRGLLHVTLAINWITA